MTDYYKYIDKIQDKMQDDTFYYDWCEERREYYVTDRRGTIIYTIPADRWTLDATKFYAHHIGLKKLWETTEAGAYYLVTPDKMSKVKDTKNKRTLWKLEAENKFFPIHNYIDNRLVIGFNIAGKKTKYHVYIAGGSKPVLIYAYEDGAAYPFENRNAIILPVIK